MREEEEDGQGFPHTIPYACLKDVAVQPFVASPVRTFTGGPVLERAEHQVFRHLQAGKPVDGFLADQRYDDHLSGDFLYGGPLYRHFGHFLSEMVHRIVPSQGLGLPFKVIFVNVLVDPVPGSFEALPPYIRDVLRFFDLSKDDVVIVSRNTIVERLHIVQQSAALGSYPKPGYLRALRTYASRRLDAIHGDVARPSHLYVSRSALPKQGSFLGEAYVEARFERAGFHVFRPERHGVTEQMDHYRKAEKIVFPGGSACHGVELLGRRSLRTVVFFPRTPGQDYMFRRVLKPRSIDCAFVDIATYLGTLSHGRDGIVMTHLGVSVFDPRAMESQAEALDPGLPDGVPALGYAKAAASDLLGFFSESRRSGERRDPVGAARLLTRFVGAMLALGRWRLGEAVRSVLGRPAAAAVPAPERSVLTDQEVAQTWSAAGALGHPFGPFFRVALLTLQPQPSLAAMRWSELSPDRGTWTIPAARVKDGRPHVVPLSQPVRAILAELPHLPGCDLVFQTKGKPLNGIASARQALGAEVARARRQAAGALSWATIDFRRTGSLRLTELGYDRLAIRRLLAFPAQPQEADATQPPGERARMLDEWASEIATMVRDMEDRRAASGPT